MPDCRRAGGPDGAEDGVVVAVCRGEGGGGRVGGEEGGAGVEGAVDGGAGAVAGFVPACDEDHPGIVVVVGARGGGGRGGWGARREDFGPVVFGQGGDVFGGEFGGAGVDGGGEGGGGEVGFGEGEVGFEVVDEGFLVLGGGEG